MQSMCVGVFISEKALDSLISLQNEYMHLMKVKQTKLSDIFKAGPSQNDILYLNVFVCCL